MLLGKMLVTLRRNASYLYHNLTVPELYTIHDCHPLYDIIRYLFFFRMVGKGGIGDEKKEWGKNEPASIL